jgi:ribosome-binding protein aMBF1 (putative translation factor)
LPVGHILILAPVAAIADVTSLTAHWYDAVQWAYDRFIRDYPEMVEFFEEMGVKADIARQIYELRNQAGLSPEQLAELAGTTATVIEDIEESDYDGDFLAMASKIASALHRKVEVRIVPSESSESAQITQ